MTAVEWLVGQLKEYNHLSYDEQSWIFEQAKEMEKENLYNFYIQGGIDCATQADRTVEDFYNETFKNTKE
jgi:predicted small secreted protein